MGNFHFSERTLETKPEKEAKNSQEICCLQGWIDVCDSLDLLLLSTRGMGFRRFRRGYTSTLFLSLRLLGGIGLISTSGIHEHCHPYRKKKSFLQGISCCLFLASVAIVALEEGTIKSCSDIRKTGRDKKFHVSRIGWRYGRIMNSV